MTTVKEKSILFSGPMVRAILEGRKTQTRRVLKKPENYGCPTGDCPHDTQDQCNKAMQSLCPYGNVGDRLWVREAFNVYNEPTALEAAQRTQAFEKLCSGEEKDIVKLALEIPLPTGKKKVMYKADYGAWADNPDSDLKWKSSIHMPRWASRITLEITSIRVERLQDISEEDAKAEGVDCLDVIWASIPEPSYKGKFKWLWESINGPGLWDLNPWVWVIGFKRV